MQLVSLCILQFVFITKYPNSEGWFTAVNMGRPGVDLWRLCCGSGGTSDLELLQIQFWIIALTLLTLFPCFVTIGNEIFCIGRSISVAWRMRQNGLPKITLESRGRVEKICSETFQSVLAGIAQHLAFSLLQTIQLSAGTDIWRLMNIWSGQGVHSVRMGAAFCSNREKRNLNPYPVLFLVSSLKA